jgi:hypothetical protein
MKNGRLRAWMKIPANRAGVVAAFVGVSPGSDVPLRGLPATKHFVSRDEARQWVEREAQAIGGVSVERVGKP